MYHLRNIVIVYQCYQFNWVIKEWVRLYSTPPLEDATPHTCEPQMNLILSSPLKTEMDHDRKSNCNCLLVKIFLLTSFFWSFKSPFHFFMKEPINEDSTKSMQTGAWLYLDLEPVTWRLNFDLSTMESHQKCFLGKLYGPVHVLRNYMF